MPRQQSRRAPSDDGGSVDVTSDVRKTAYGLMPADWALSTVDSLAARKRNAIVGGPFGSDLVSRDYTENGVPVIRGQNMGEPWVEGPFVFVSRSKADSLAANTARPGDLVFTQRGTLGQVSVVPAGEHERYVISQSQMKVSLDTAVVDPSYVFYVFKGDFHQELIRQGTIQTGVPHINLGILRRLPVPRPPLPEQQAIAATLADVDALLEALLQLIAKKRDLKQAVMQQLLTGQARLPGFRSEWAQTKLGEIAEIVSGATPNTRIAAYWDGTIGWCTPTDITAMPGKYLSETERQISPAGLSACSARLLPVGTLLLCSRATLGEVKIAAREMCTNQGFKSLIVKNGLSNDFLYYLLLTMKPRMVERATGSTFLEISGKDVAALKVRLPPYDEQEAIGTILSDMDAELDALEQRLTKTRALKQGMMQALLTGHVRLAQAEAV